MRNAVWNDDLWLWEDTFIKSPNKTRVCVNLAFAYKRAGKHERGIAALARAFDIDPDLPLFFEASKYANEQGGRLVTERGVWEPIRTPSGKRPYMSAIELLELK